MRTLLLILVAGRSGVILAAPTAGLAVSDVERMDN